MLRGAYFSRRCCRSSESAQRGLSRVDFFVEVLSRENKLALVLNLDFSDIDDPSGHAENATQYAFITGANEKGGGALFVNSISDMASAIHLVSQAYEGACE